MLAKFLKKFLTPTKNQNGNTMIAVVGITLGIMALEAGLQQIGVDYMAIASSRSAGARDALAQQIQRYSSMTSTIRSSVYSNDSENAQLKKCILGTGVCDANVEIPVALYYPWMGSSGSSGITKISGGSTSSAKAYDTKGIPCADNSNSKCPFSVVTTFTATCEPTPISATPSSCSPAKSITIRYKISYNNSLGSSSRISIANIDSTSVVLSRNQIISVPRGDYTTNKTVQVLVAIDPAISSAIEEAIQENHYDEVPGLAAQIRAALSGLTDVGLVKMLANAGITSHDQAQKIYQAFQEAYSDGNGTIDITTATSLAEAGVTDSHVIQMFRDSGTYIEDPSIVKAILDLPIDTNSPPSFYWNFIYGVGSGSVWGGVTAADVAQLYQAALYIENNTQITDEYFKQGMILENAAGNTTDLSIVQNHIDVFSAVGIENVSLWAEYYWEACNDTKNITVDIVKQIEFDLAAQQAADAAWAAANPDTTDTSSSDTVAVVDDSSSDTATSSTASVDVTVTASNNKTVSNMLTECSSNCTNKTDL